MIVIYIIIFSAIILFTTAKFCPPAKNQITLSHPVLFFERESFYQGIMQAGKQDKKFTYHISGGIIPHHLFPAFIQADFFQRLSSQKPKTIIVLGPNHYEKGEFRFLSSAYAWETLFGKVIPDQTIVSDLVNKNIIHINEDVLLHEHSVAGIMPFIKYYLPETKVVPVVISNFTTLEEIGFFADNLNKYLNKDTVLIASVDFSHYLNNFEAQNKDKLSLQIIKDYDYKRLFTLNNDYMDSPPSVAILLLNMQKTGKTKMDILQHTNSGEIQKNDFIPTTSYYSIAFY